jgi:peptidoglycan/LPS O-acetylase OafA/YrhL
MAGLRDAMVASGGETATSEAQGSGRPRPAWVDNLRMVVVAGVIAAHVGTAHVIDVD